MVKNTIAINEIKILKAKILEITGGFKLTAIKAECSVSFVSQVLSGRKQSTKVIDAAIAVAEEKKEENKQRIQKIIKL